jgi:hypothetical protein
VAFASKAKLTDVSASIDSVEAAIRAAVPVARVIYIEPDVYTPANAFAPHTDAIVIKGTD